MVCIQPPLELKTQSRFHPISLSLSMYGLLKLLWDQFKPVHVGNRRASWHRQVRCEVFHWPKLAVFVRPPPSSVTTSASRLLRPAPTQAV